MKNTKNKPADQKTVLKVNQPTLKKVIASALTPPPPERVYRPASVSLLLFGREETRILAILKANRQGYTWRNQVALPGGRIEESDADPMQAAVRELKEELGISPENVSYAGSLGHFQTLENTVIEVFAGTWNQQDTIRYDPAEIARVLEIPLRTVIATHFSNGLHGRLPEMMELLYPFEDLVIWGVTAKILHFFVEALVPELETSGKPLTEHLLENLS
ncbi:MAG: NUDIX hydrolase [Desulfosudaceae bacterium]